MRIEQTVEIPPSHKLIVDVPLEIPAGKTILTFTPVSASSGNTDLEYAEKVWAYNRAHPTELETKLQKLKGRLGEDAFGGLDGVAYQHTVRKEWND
jgi:hypothetical protein